MVPTLSVLQRLPVELLHDILELLEKPDLSQLNLASRWCYQAATPLIWKEVELTDCSNKTQYDGEDAVDDHDDTPMLKKLLILTKKPWIASHVQTVTHRCHLPPPAIFNELPNATFAGKTLSQDLRTTKLVLQAVRRMHKVHTLRLIFGHLTINTALLHGFFAADREKETPVRRLWLENCDVPKILEQPGLIRLHGELDFTGLESVRFRRLLMKPPFTRDEPPLGGSTTKWVHSRVTWVHRELQDGAGGYYSSGVLSEGDESTYIVRGDDGDYDSYGPLKVLMRPAREWDAAIFSQFERLGELPMMRQHSEDARWTNRQGRADLKLDGSELSRPLESDEWSERYHSGSMFLGEAIVEGSAASLVSICFDWVLMNSDEDPVSHHHRYWVNMYLMFFILRFPLLRALQFRNHMVTDTAAPEGLHLLDHFTALSESETKCNRFRRDISCVTIEFMEAHSDLRCLAWPMDAFFSSHSTMETGLRRRVDAIIDNLGRTLVDLRVDAPFRIRLDPQSENVDCPDISARRRRRRFIEEFASRMTSIESIKIEGGVPRDERKETIRALHACPLQKIVMIGVSTPVGNTWGEFGHDLGEVEVEDLEGEDKATTHALGMRPPVPVDANFSFDPTYGWSSEPPMIHTIASHHASTVAELKFCGYQGSPILFTPTPITTPLLAGLKAFTNLRSLILSMWLSTIFEEASRDSEIIKYWLDARSPTSTSLVRTVVDEEPEGWEKALRTRYAPHALAWEVTRLVGSFLSEEAKARKGGVHVRASICIGEASGIFDIDLYVGKGSLNSDVCLGYKGPREELEPERRRSKLESRRWF